MSDRTALRSAHDALDEAQRKLEASRSAVDRSRAFAAGRGQEVAKFDALVVSLTEACAGAAKSYAKGNGAEPELSLPDELKRAHRAREDAQVAFDLARHTVDELEAELADAERTVEAAREDLNKAALAVLADEAERRVDDVLAAQGNADRQRDRLLQLVALLRVNHVVIPSAVQQVFLPRPVLRAGGSLVVTAGPWADELSALGADPDHQVDVQPEPAPAPLPQRPVGMPRVIRHKPTRPLPSSMRSESAESDQSSESSGSSSSFGGPVEAA